MIKLKYKKYNAQDMINEVDKDGVGVIRRVTIPQYPIVKYV